MSATIELTKPRTKPSSSWSITSPRIKPSKIIARLVLLVIVIAFLAPMLWLLLGSLHSDSALTVQFGGHYTFDNFRAVMNEQTLWLPLRNSLILSGGTTIITVLCRIACGVSAVALPDADSASCSSTRSCSRPACRSPPSWCRSTRCSPTSTSLTRSPATIFFMSATSLPFAIWMMKNFMDGVPVSLEEAAWTDGAGWFQALRRIVLPLMAPGIAVVSIFVFVHAMG